MKAPLCEFVKKYAAGNTLRLHMPGHKGQGMFDVEKFDITEIHGADVLYAADGVLRESQDNASQLFGSGTTVYSAEGSSLSIRAMLYLALLCKKEAGKPVILAARNAHKTFLSAAALLDFEIEWLYPAPEETGGGLLSCPISPAHLRQKIEQMEREEPKGNGGGKKPVAFYLTSPDYLGNLQDVEALARICHENGILFLVDNAHGAYLQFLPVSRHPMALGADACCDSAHKTLPVLTGGAYLHISAQAPAVMIENATRAMELFASTSPSYLILQSLDAANGYLDGAFRADLRQTIERVDLLKNRLTEKGLCLVGKEPLKLTVMPKPFGYTGTELASFLRAQGVECEFSDPDFAVMMFAPGIGEADFAKLWRILAALPARPAIAEVPPPLTAPRRALSPREAILAPSELIPVEECFGRVLAQANVACPPAIPIVSLGEVIGNEEMRLFAYYGIPQARVVCEMKKR